jgi:hypothetical protein
MTTSTTIRIILMVKKITPTHKATHTVMWNAHTSRAMMLGAITTRMQVHATPIPALPIDNQRRRSVTTT